MGFFSRGTLALLAGCGGAASIAESRLQMLKSLESRSPWVRLGAHVRLENAAYGGCGVVVRGGAVAAGTALVSVDAPLFAPGGAAGDVGARAAAAVGAGKSDADVFAICAAMRGAETDDESRWAPYRAALPWASLRESHPLHWSDADIAAAAPPGGAARVAALKGLADALEGATGRAPLATAVEAVACGVSRAIRAPRSKRPPRTLASIVGDLLALHRLPLVVLCLSSLTLVAALALVVVRRAEDAGGGASKARLVGHYAVDAAVILASSLYQDVACFALAPFKVAASGLRALYRVLA